MAHYRFFTTWLLEAPRQDAWDALHDALAWPLWWKGVDWVRQEHPGDDRGVGSRYTIAWRSRIPYPLEFGFHVDEVDAPHRMAGRASGELEGTGVWRLWEHGELTAVTYDWRVVTTKPWMNLIAPLARPVFRWNHDVVMRQGGEGLARLLRAPLVAHG